MPLVVPPTPLDGGGVWASTPLGTVGKLTSVSAASAAASAASASSASSSLLRFPVQGHIHSELTLAATGTTTGEAGGRGGALNAPSLWLAGSAARQEDGSISLRGDAKGREHGCRRLGGAVWCRDKMAVTGGFDTSILLQAAPTIVETIGETKGEAMGEAMDETMGEAGGAQDGPAIGGGAPGGAPDGAHTGIVRCVFQSGSRWALRPTEDFDLAAIAKGSKAARRGDGGNDGDSLDTTGSSCR